MTTPRKLKNGADAHDLTAEQRAKGGRNAAAKKKELAMSFRERLARAYNDQAEELAQVAIDAGREDWRALFAGLDQAFGKPPQEITGDIDQTVTIVVQSAFEEDDGDTDDPGSVQGDPEAA